MYSFDSKVRYSETGSDARMSPVMILNYFQDSSTMQSEDLGIGIEYLSRFRAAWVLNFWQLDIIRRPYLGEKIKISTIPYKFSGVLGNRNYLMTTAEGERLAMANAIYTLLNMEKHIPCKPDDKMMKAYELEERLDMEYLPRKILFEGNPVRGKTIRVLPHNLDTNDHVNNAQYIDMAFDVLPETEPVRILASYHISAVKGDMILPFIYDEPEGYGVDLRRSDGESYCRIRIIKKTD